MPQRPAEKTGVVLGSVLIVMTLLGWSSVPLFLKHFSHSIDLWTSNGWRYGFSAFLWLPVVVIGLLRGTLPAGLWRAALVPSAFNALGQTCFTWSFYEIDPGLASFALRMHIVFVAIGAYIFFASERRVIRTRGYLAGALMVLLGTFGTLALAPADGSPGIQSLATHALGFTLAVLAGLFFACYALSVRHFMHGTGSIIAFAAISQFTAIVMIALMLALGNDAGRSAWALGWGQFGLLLLSAVIGIALGHVFYYAAIARLGVAVSSGVVQLQPVLVTAASVPLFGERMTPGQLAFGALAILGAGVMVSVQHVLARRDRAAAELEEAAGEAP